MQQKGKRRFISCIFNKSFNSHFMYDQAVPLILIVFWPKMLNSFGLFSNISATKHSLLITMQQNQQATRLQSIKFDFDRKQEQFRENCLTEKVKLFQKYDKIRWEEVFRHDCSLSEWSSARQIAFIISYLQFRKIDFKFGIPCQSQQKSKTKPNCILFKYCSLEECLKQWELIVWRKQLQKFLPKKLQWRKPQVFLSKQTFDNSKSLNSRPNRWNIIDRKQILAGSNIEQANSYLNYYAQTKETQSKSYFLDIVGPSLLPPRNSQKTIASLMIYHFQGPSYKQHNFSNSRILIDKKINKQYQTILADSLGCFLRL